MDDLDRQLESYARRYREASQASPEAVEAALDRVVERVAAGDPGMDLGADVAANAAAGAATGKVLVMVIVGGAIAGAAWLGTREPSRAPQVDEPASALEWTQGIGVPAEPRPAVAPVEPGPTVAPVVSARPSPAKRSQEAEPAPADTMLEELELLRRARAAQRGGDLEHALELLAEHERRFPESALGEERMATRVVVLCGLGRLDQAKAAEAEITQRYPRSTYLETVRRVCAREATPAGEQGQSEDENSVPQIPASVDMAGGKKE